MSLSSRCSGPGLKERLCRGLSPKRTAGGILGDNRTIATHCMVLSQRCASPEKSVSMLCSPCTGMPAGLLMISKSVVCNKIGISVGMRACLPEVWRRLPEVWLWFCSPDADLFRTGCFSAERSISEIDKISPTAVR